MSEIKMISITTEEYQGIQSQLREAREENVRITAYGDKLSLDWTNKFGTLESELAAAKAEIEHYKVAIIKLKVELDGDNEDLEKLESENKRMRKALEDILNVDHGCDETDYCCAQNMVVHEDAKAALSPEK